MPTAALAVTAAFETAAFAKAGVRGGASAGCVIVFLQTDTPAHACVSAGMAETQCRQIN